MRGILVTTVAATALVSACSSTTEPVAVTPAASATDAFTAQCVGFGYIAGTPDVAQCAERLAQDVRTRAGKRETTAREAADAQFNRASGTVAPWAIMHLPNPREPVGSVIKIAHPQR